MALTTMAVDGECHRPRASRRRATAADAVALNVQTPIATSAAVSAKREARKALERARAKANAAGRPQASHTRQALPCLGRLGSAGRG